MDTINWALLLPIIAIQLILMVTAIIDLIRSNQTNGPKLLWAIIILFVSVLGPIFYFVFGRKRD